MQALRARRQGAAGGKEANPQLVALEAENARLRELVRPRLPDEVHDMQSEGRRSQCRRTVRQPAQLKPPGLYRLCARSPVGCTPLLLL